MTLTNDAETIERERLCLLAYGHRSTMRGIKLEELRAAAERKQGRPCPAPTAAPKREAAKPAAKPASVADDVAVAERAAFLADLDRRMGLA